MHIIQKTFEQMYGHYCWYVGGVFGPSMRFGKTTLKVLKTGITSSEFSWLEKRRIVFFEGDWDLTIWNALWQIRYKNQIIVTDECLEQEKCETKLRCAYEELKGQKLTNFSMNSKNGETFLYFDLGFSVRIYQSSKKRKRRKLFYISKPTGYFLTICSNGTYKHVPGRSPCDLPDSYYKVIPYDFNC